MIIRNAGCFSFVLRHLQDTVFYLLDCLMEPRWWSVFQPLHLYFRQVEAGSGEGQSGHFTAEVYKDLKLGG